jgi:hypothetical protein
MVKLYSCPHRGATSDVIGFSPLVPGEQEGLGHGSFGAKSWFFAVKIETVFRNPFQL